MLQADYRFRLVSGDCGFDNEPLIRELEEVGQPYLFKLKGAKLEVKMEAITSRPLLLARVGQMINHAGQTTLYLTPIHTAKISLVDNIRRALRHAKLIAEQLKNLDLGRL